MKKIFIGLFFVFSDLNLLAVNFMPAFVGYILIFLGLDEEYECPSLTGSRTICFGAAIQMAAVWVAALMGYGMTFPLSATLKLLVTYRLLMWAAEQGGELGWDDGDLRPLRTSWYALAGATLASVALSWINFAAGIVWAVASAGCMVWYIVRYYKLWKSAVTEEK